MPLFRFQRFAQTAHGVAVLDRQRDAGLVASDWQDHVLDGLKVAGATLLLAASLAPFSSVWAQSPGSNVAQPTVSSPAWHATYEQEAHDLLDRSMQAGLLTRMPHLSVSAPLGGESDAMMLPGMTCNIVWQLDAMGRAESLDPTKSGPSSMVSGALYREASLLHEASHCELSTVTNPLRGTGLPPEAEAWLNEWVVGQPSAVTNPFGSQFSESSADTYGLIQLLALHHFSPDAVAEVRRWQHDRRQGRETLERTGAPWHADPHMTDFALQHLLDHLDTVRQAAPSTYEDMALRFASQGFMDWINPQRAVLPSHQSSATTFGPEALEALIGAFDNDDWFGMDVGYQVTVLKAEKQGVLPSSNASSHARTMASAFLQTEKPFAGMPQARVVRSSHGLVWQGMSDADMERFEESLRSETLNTTFESWKNSHGWNAVRLTMYNGLAPGYLRATVATERQRRQVLASVLAEADELSRVATAPVSAAKVPSASQPSVPTLHTASRVTRRTKA